MDNLIDSTARYPERHYVVTARERVAALLHEYRIGGKRHALGKAVLHTPEPVPLGRNRERTLRVGHRVNLHRWKVERYTGPFEVGRILPRRENTVSAGWPGHQLLLRRVKGSTVSYTNGNCIIVYTHALKHAGVNTWGTYNLYVDEVYAAMN